MIKKENNSTIHLIGNAHLDPIWLWRWQEGCGEVLQTFRSALDRLNEYPDFIFTCSSASYYEWVEEIDPDMFAEIAVRVKEGRWVPVNGWWVQPDCNMPSGESFARHALYSQLYYYEKFGVTCSTGYNVDSFGHCAMIPQLLKLGGMDNYVMHRPGTYENPEIPENLFWWESPDGSKVLTYRIPSGYGSSGQASLDKEINNSEERITKTGHDMMLFYGVGNHGGGPTRFDIEHLGRKKDLAEGIGLKYSSPDIYFKDVLAKPLDVPSWNDDLQHHASGCYSAMSEVKKLNRMAENALVSAEMWSTVATITSKLPKANQAIKTAWKDVLFNQFHDIFDGCSIREAYDDVRDSMGHALTISARAENNAILRITRGINTWIEGVSKPVDGDEDTYSEVRHQSAPSGFPRPVVVFNPLSFDVSVPVQTYHPSEVVEDSEGHLVPYQNVRSSRSNDSHLDTLFLADIPAMGYATYWLHARTKKNGAVKTGVHAQSLTIENEHMRVRFCRETGFISSLADSKGNEYLSSLGARLDVIDDHKTDTWAHMVFKFHDLKGQMELISIRLIESGPMRALIRTKHKFGNSILTQNFSLSANQKTLRVECKAIWQEEFTMLKIAFPAVGANGISTYEIPCGYIKRPCNGEEEPALAWADITTDCAQGKQGISIITDSKYSYDCPGNELRLTALRNVIFADHYSHRPDADFSFTDEGLQRFEYGIYLHEGDVEKSDIVKESAMFNNQPVPVPEGFHKGEFPQKKSFLSISEENIIVTALKFSEDDSDDMILRCYEAKGIKTNAVINLDLLNISFNADLNPHEIKTYRIKSEGSVEIVNFLEGIVK